MSVNVLASATTTPSHARARQTIDAVVIPVRAPRTRTMPTSTRLDALVHAAEAAGANHLGFNVADVETSTAMAAPSQVQLQSQADVEHDIPGLDNTPRAPLDNKKRVAFVLPPTRLDTPQADDEVEIEREPLRAKKRVIIELPSNRNNQVKGKGKGKAKDGPKSPSKAGSSSARSPPSFPRGRSRRSSNSPTSSKAAAGLVALSLNAVRPASVPIPIPMRANTRAAVKAEREGETKEVEAVDIALGDGDVDMDAGADSTPAQQQEAEEPPACTICYEDIADLVATAIQQGKGGEGGEMAIYYCDKPKCRTAFCMSCALSSANRQVDMYQKPTCPNCTLPVNTDSLEAQAKTYDPNVAAPLRKLPPNPANAVLPWVRRFLHYAPFRPVDHTSINDFILYFFRHAVPNAATSTPAQQRQHIAGCIVAWTGHWRIPQSNALNAILVNAGMMPIESARRLCFHNLDYLARPPAVTPATPYVPAWLGAQPIELTNAERTAFERIYPFGEQERLDAIVVGQALAQRFDADVTRDAHTLVLCIVQLLQQGKTAFLSLLLAEPTRAHQDFLYRFFLALCVDPTLMAAYGNLDVLPLVRLLNIGPATPALIELRYPRLPHHGPIAVLAMRYGFAKRKLARAPAVGPAAAPAARMVDARGGPLRAGAGEGAMAVMRALLERMGVRHAHLDGVLGAARDRAQPRDAQVVPAIGNEHGEQLQALAQLDFGIPGDREQVMRAARQWMRRQPQGLEAAEMMAVAAAAVAEARGHGQAAQLGGEGHGRVRR